MEQMKSKSESLISSSSSSTPEEIDREIDELLPSLPKAHEGTTMELSLYQGVWIATKLTPLRSFPFFQKFFQAHDTDIIIASLPKSGTTWLKALIFSIVNRNRYTPSNTLLLTTNPHLLVPFLDAKVFVPLQIPDLSTIPSPRLFSTHIHYSKLPESMKQSKCQIIYICRNPFDSAVSCWHHYREIQPDFDVPLDEFFEMYFNGISWYGPYWDNVLGFWKESQKNPTKLLFLKYEEMIEDTAKHLKRIAEFIRYPFSKKEERDGVVQEILDMCSLKKLKEANLDGMFSTTSPNKAFFRKGEVGNGIKSLSPPKRQHLENMMHEKLKGSGLSFKLST